MNDFFTDLTAAILTRPVQPITGKQWDATRNEAKLLLSQYKNIVQRDNLEDRFPDVPYEIVFVGHPPYPVNSLIDLTPQ